MNILYNKRIIIIRNGANTICLPNFAWGAIITTLIDMSTPDLVVLLSGGVFQNGCRCHGNGQNAFLKKK
jgi:hypothetical protein